MNTTGTQTTEIHYQYRRLELGGVIRYSGTSAIHAASFQDRTPEHFTYPSGYDSNCDWCWLNASHTQAAHAAKIER